MPKIKLCFVLGTRPEVIKLAPLIIEAKKEHAIETVIINTGQHQDLSDRVFEVFGIKPDYNLRLMQENQTLEGSVSSLLTSLTPILKKIKPNWVVVQGDTNSTFAGALSAFYQKIPVAHVEAGLRSDNIYAPWPEEINRRLVSQVTALHFTPTSTDTENLIHEGVKPETILQTGNTGIDALKILNKKIDDFAPVLMEVRHQLTQMGLPDDKKRIVLITAHRRESFEKGIANICDAIISLAKKFPETNFIFSTHPNPRVSKTVFEKLKNTLTNIVILPALGYLEFVWLMKQSCLVMTDSGGIQEEAPSLGKRVVVLREVTERIDGLKTGFVRLAGTDFDRITTQVSEGLTEVWPLPSKPTDIYGNGTASSLIVQALKTGKF